MPKKRNMFDERWKNEPFKNRGMKSFLTPNPIAESFLEECMETHQENVAHLGSIIRRKLCDGQLFKDDLLKQGAKVADALWKEQDDYFENTAKMHLARQKRSSALIAIRLFKGYFQRNKEIPYKVPRLRHTKATFMTDGIIKDKTPEASKGVFSWTVCGKDEKGKAKKIDVPYHVPQGMMSKKKFLPRSYGGNLVHKNGQWSFMAMVTIPYEWAYQPKCSLGFDLNKTAADFITLSSKINFDGQETDCIPRSAVLERCAKRLVELNKQINDKNIKSSQRRAIRRKWKTTHRRMKRLCRPICEQIISEAIRKKALMCIDDLSCGASMGSFGQDKLVAMLVEMCENQRVPFVRVPTRYTSKMCNKCKVVCKRTSTGEIECKNCGKVPAHSNAAKNIALWGNGIWQHGMKKFKKWLGKKIGKKQAPDQSEESKVDVVS